VVAGRYRLVEPVSDRDAGGVWRAVDGLTGAEVAVKLLAARPADDAAATMRFRLVGTAALALAAPRIARVLDFGEAVLPDGLAVPYVVRDLVVGETLEERLARGPLPAGEALRIVAAVAAALAVAHEGGAAHGHLVPANIVLVAGNVMLTDFGLAPLSRRPAAAASAGVLSYTPPELAGGGPATPAADMYALGVVFTACLTGITAPDAVLGASPAGTVAPDTVPPDTVPPDTVPPGLAALWAACLGPSPAERPTAAHAAAVSRQALGTRPGSAAPLAPAQPRPAGPPAPRPAPRPAAARSTPRCRRLATVGKVAAATAATSGVLALLMFSLARHQGGTNAPARTPAASGSLAATGPPSAEATSSAKTTPPPTMPSSLTVIRRISATIRTYVGTGQIRQDVGVDLDNLIQPVATDLAAGRVAPVAQLARTLRAKVATRLGEGALSQAAARALDDEISTLSRSAAASRLSRSSTPRR